MSKITIKDSNGNNILASGIVGETAISIEGSYYFDKSVINFTNIKMKGEGQQYTCPIKRGTCDYYNLIDDSGDTVIDEIGWIYEDLENSNFDIIKGKMAFYQNKVETIVE